MNAAQVSWQVWEIYSEGYEPYPSLSNIQTRAKIIVQNYRMDMPEVVQYWLWIQFVSLIMVDNLVEESMASWAGILLFIFV